MFISFFQEVYLDILQTLSGVIADIILSSDRSKGTSTLVLSFDKQPINGEEIQVLSIEIYGEEASTIYPIAIPPQVFQFELIGVIRNADNRDSLVQGIYTILLQNFENVLDPTVIYSPEFEGSGGDMKKNVRHFDF